MGLLVNTRFQGRFQLVVARASRKLDSKRSAVLSPAPITPRTHLALCWPHSGGLHTSPQSLLVNLVNRIHRNRGASTTRPLYAVR